jgi:hypothetical protein
VKNLGKVESFGTDAQIVAWEFRGGYDCDVCM